MSEVETVFISGEPVDPVDPLVVASISFVLPNQFTMTWEGGRAPYSVQQLVGTEWIEVEDTEQNSSTITTDDKEGYYRVATGQ